MTDIMSKSRNVLVHLVFVNPSPLRLFPPQHLWFPPLRIGRIIHLHGRRETSYRVATVRTAPVLLVSCSYELRSTCNADVARRHNDELAGRQFISVLPQRLIQMFDFGLQLGPRKPEKQHASVGEALIENQLAEIPVGNNQNSLFLAGDRKDILVGKTMGVISGDGRNVVAEGSKVVDKAKVSLDRACERSGDAHWTSEPARACSTHVTRVASSRWSP